MCLRIIRLKSQRFPVMFDRARIIASFKHEIGKIGVGVWKIRCEPERAPVVGDRLLWLADLSKRGRETVVGLGIVRVCLER